ncbi:MAG: hypothetical protein ACXV2E_07475, partial [Halobacteriota archaeon]
MIRKHFFVVIVAVLLTATVCAAGCAANNSSPTAVPSPTQNPAFVPKSISGYRNYTNSSAGIAIQYPSAWQLTQGG